MPRQSIRLLAALLAAVLLAACAGIEMRPGETSHARRDNPPGPGILSGKDGEFVLFRLEAPPRETEAASPAEDKTGGAATPAE